MRNSILTRRGGFRLAGRRPGKTREKLAEMLTEKLKAWGPGYYVEPENLSRNNPCYVNVRCDGVSWDGYAYRQGFSGGTHLYSYHPMGELVKIGFKLMTDGECLIE